VVHFEHLPATRHVAERLGIAVGEKVSYSVRIRYSDDVAVAILHNWIPASIGAITEAQLAKSGLYETFRNAGVFPRIGKQRLSARKVTNLEADQLDLPHGSAVLTMERTAYDSAGLAVEHGEHIYRPDLYSLEFTVVNKQ